MVKSKTTVLATTTTLLFLSERGEARRRSSSSQQQPRGRRRRSISAPASSSSRMSSKASSSAAPASAGKTLFGCGTTLSDALHTLSPSTLCLGLDTYCPQNQVCYALPPISSSSKDHHQDLLVRQGILEGEWMDQLMKNREEQRQEQLNSHGNEYEEFVCGLDYDHAVQSVCHPDYSLDVSSSSSSVSASSSVFASSPIHCLSGMSSQCPQEMECYASVFCDSMLVLQQQQSYSVETLPSQKEQQAMKKQKQQQEEESEAISIKEERSDKNLSNSSLDDDDSTVETNKDASVSWFGYANYHSSLWNSISFSS